MSLLFSRRVRLVLLPPAAAALLAFCGCGTPGGPMPPSLMLPLPVSDLSAARTGDAVTLRWTTTRRTTDRVVLSGDQQAVICRAIGSGACDPVGTILVAPNAPAMYIDTLPIAMQTGPLRLLRYEVLLQNRKGRDAGSSNLAYTAAGWAPAPVTEASASLGREGIAVQWKTPPNHPVTDGASLVVKLVRQRVLQPGESEKPGKDEVQAGVPQPMLQTLEAPQHAPLGGSGQWTPNHTLDKDAQLNRRYQYTVQLVEQVNVESHPMQLAGVSLTTAVLDAKPDYAPDAPTGLAAVANSAGGTIDLSWDVSGSAQVAGYVVYRHVAGDGQPGQRVSGAKPLATPAWSDTAAQRGVRYAYSVAAVDGTGRKSARSAEQTEQLQAAGGSSQ